MDKATILKAFNDHFAEFVEDIANVFPDNRDVATTKNALFAVRKANPRLILQCWKIYVATPYAKKIEDGDALFYTWLKGTVSETTITLFPAGVTGIRHTNVSGTTRMCLVR